MLQGACTFVMIVRIRNFCDVLKAALNNPNEIRKETLRRQPLAVGKDKR